MSSILPKNELENVNFGPSLLGQKFFVPLFEKIEKTKKLFHNQPTFINDTFTTLDLEVIFAIKLS